jgi:hypothetical protein
MDAINSTHLKDKFVQILFRKPQRSEQHRKFKRKPIRQDNIKMNSPDDGGSTHIRYVCQLQCDYTALYPRRL